MKITLRGFMPDADPNSDGAIVDCVNIVPTVRGFAASLTGTSAGMPLLTEPVIGSGLVIQMDGTRRLFIGTKEKILEAATAGWQNVSRSGMYTPATDTRWRFTQYGNATIATNTTDVLQVSTAGDFADIAGAPKARIIETVAGFVMAFATNDPLNGDMPDMWWSSGLYDHLAWTPSQATQSANGRLLDSPGAITAAKKLGNDIVAYKNSSMYLGQFVGPPIIWQWQQIPGEIGAISQEAVVSIDTAHVFIGADDFWMYDGARPISIGAPVREWFFNNSSAQYRYRTIGYYDRFNGLVYWYFASNWSQDGALDKALVYNVKTKAWGLVVRTIQTAIEYINQGLTYDTVGDSYPTYDDFFGLSFDSPQWFAQGSSPAIVTMGGDLQLLSGTADHSSFTTNEIGDGGVYTTVSQIRPRFLTRPAASTLQLLYYDDLMPTIQIGPVADIWDGKYDALNEARIHQLNFSFTGNMEVTTLDVKIFAGGER